MSEVLWEQCLGKLEAELSEQNLNTWIRPLQAELSGSRLRIMAPNRFVRDMVRSNFQPRIQEIASHFATPDAVTVDLVIGSGIDALDATLPTAAVAPLSAVASSWMRGWKLLRTVSSTKRFGARMRSSSRSSSACSGRIQVLSCCSESSASSCERQRSQSGALKAGSPDDRSSKDARRPDGGPFGPLARDGTRPSWRGGDRGNGAAFRCRSADDCTRSAARFSTARGAGVAHATVRSRHVDAPRVRRLRAPA